MVFFFAIYDVNVFFNGVDAILVFWFPLGFLFWLCFLFFFLVCMFYGVEGLMVFFYWFCFLFFFFRGGFTLLGGFDSDFSCGVLSIFL